MTQPPKASQVLISESDLRSRTESLAREISDYYTGRRPVCIGVLTGAFVFMADLVRELTIDVDIEFMAVSSYGDATKSSGVVQILKDLTIPLEGREVLVVEDIVDSGLTLDYLVGLLEDRSPAEIKIVALLRKDSPRTTQAEVDWVGFDIEDEFVVGYGLDLAGRFRNLPYVGRIEADDAAHERTGE